MEYAKIVEWYDGYKFEENAEPVINPVSLGKCLQNRKFANYWSATAMPTFLLDILRKKPLDFSCVNIPETELGNYEPSDPRDTTLLYQTGYLTISRFKNLGGSRLYTLDFPNREVRESFLHDLAPVYSGLREDQAGSAQIAARSTPASTHSLASASR